MPAKRHVTLEDLIRHCVTLEGIIAVYQHLDSHLNDYSTSDLGEAQKVIRIENDIMDTIVLSGTVGIVKVN
jgi:hypothetical protein